MTHNTFAISDDELITAAGILGISVNNQQALNNFINDGLDAGSLKLLQNELPLNSSELSQLLNISTRTLSRRKACGKLNTDESKRVFLLAVMAATANHVLKNQQSALRWLKSPKRVFHGKSPLDHAKTVQQIEEVINLLHQIEHGIFI